MARYILYDVDNPHLVNTYKCEVCSRRMLLSSGFEEHLWESVGGRVYDEIGPRPTVPCPCGQHPHLPGGRDREADLRL